MRNVIAALLAALSLASPAVVAAQSENQTERSFEIGIEGGGASGKSFLQDRASAGARFGYALAESANKKIFLAVAAEAEINWIGSGKAPTATVGAQGIEGLFGGRIGMRGTTNGFFLKLRPGFVSFAGTLPADGNPVRKLRRFTVPLLEPGAVYEHYFGPHWALRFDAGFPYVFYPGTNILGKSVVDSPIANSQYTAGITCRF